MMMGFVHFPIIFAILFGIFSNLALTSATDGIHASAQLEQIPSTNNKLNATASSQQIEFQNLIQPLEDVRVHQNVSMQIEEVLKKNLTDVPVENVDVDETENMEMDDNFLANITNNSTNHPLAEIDGHEKEENGTILLRIQHVQQVQHVHFIFGSKKAYDEFLGHQCAEHLSPFIAQIYASKTPFLLYDLDADEKTKNEAEGSSELRERIWCNVANFCHWNNKHEAGKCLLAVGFVDHLFEFDDDSSLIAKLEGKKGGDKNAVVRIICGEERQKFEATLKEKNGPDFMDLVRFEPSEERFLKTMSIMEVAGKGPTSAGCSLVFFDSRTLSKDWPIGRTLFNGGNLLGTKDEKNQWAASKLICEMEKRGKLNLEIAEMKHRNAKMPKELGQREKEIKDVLYVKIIEEELSKYIAKSTKAPKSLWGSLFG